MAAAVELVRPYSNVELIWASPRELLNIFQADAVGCCHIIDRHQRHPGQAPPCRPGPARLLAGYGQNVSETTLSKPGSACSVVRVFGYPAFHPSLIALSRSCLPHLLLLADRSHTTLPIRPNPGRPLVVRRLWHRQQDARTLPSDRAAPSGECAPGDRAAAAVLRSFSRYSRKYFINHDQTEEDGDAHLRTEDRGRDDRGRLGEQKPASPGSTSVRSWLMGTIPVWAIASSNLRRPSDGRLRSCWND